MVNFKNTNAPGRTNTKVIGFIRKKKKIFFLDEGDYITSKEMLKKEVRKTTSGIS